MAENLKRQFIISAQGDVGGPNLDHRDVLAMSKKMERKYEDILNAVHDHINWHGTGDVRDYDFEIEVRAYQIPSYPPQSSARKGVITSV